MIVLAKILVPSDLTVASRGALETARSLAEAFKAELHLLHVVSDAPRQPWIGYLPGAEFNDLVEELQADARVRLERAAMSADVAPDQVVIATAWGDPADEIVRYARDHEIDLIVCGTHGRSGWDHLVMGSVAERIVRLARGPVLTVHAAPERSRAAA